MVQMKYFITSLIITIVSLILAFTQYTKGYDQGVLDSQHTQRLNTTYIHELVSSQRLDHGLTPLKHNTILCEAAIDRAKASIINWSHDGFTEKAQLLYFMYPKMIKVGENLSRNFISEEEMVIEWMKSPGHRDNILEPEYTDSCIMCVEQNCAHIFAAFED